MKQGKSNQAPLNDKTGPRQQRAKEGQKENSENHKSLTTKSKSDANLMVLWPLCIIFALYSIAINTAYIF